MKLIKIKLAAILSLFLIAGNLTGCKTTENASNKEKGAVIGAAGGAILGAIIGNNTGKKGDGGELGAVIGGVVGGAAGAIIGSKMDKQAEEIKEEIPGVDVQRVDDGIVITFDEDGGIFFETDKYALNTQSVEMLNKLSNVLKEYPDTKVAVVGHTDSTGNASYNMELSRDRALSVTNHLVVNNGLDRSRFTTLWYGEEQPIADNSTASGRAQNRRVNLAIVPNEKMIEEAKQEAGS
ncbi:MAG TPA: OmpA family protein [Flavobacteriaceae bacterium]|nr:OmpA family protein [Flavobacteriaceae bacterium]